jgi:hypothetical protein
MSSSTLEQRVERLERIVDQMRSKIHHQPGRDDWRKTVGAFAGDSVAKEIIDAALESREQERRQLIPR